MMPCNGMPTSQEEFEMALRAKRERRRLLPCGHPESEIRSSCEDAAPGIWSHWCAACEREAQERGKGNV